MKRTLRPAAYDAGIEEKKINVVGSQSVGCTHIRAGKPCVANDAEKREAYVDQGRSREAHGVGTAIWIFWKTLINESAGNTGYGGL